ncbi:MAG: site-specific DNA-methyltransferase [Anaerolineae bacterium]|nr:site-specific DNA-methyltransferase [Anaerolineae bacterium]
MYELIQDSKYKGGDFFNFSKTTLLPRHRWYHLKEGFSASLVEEAINQKLSGKVRSLRIFEPFGGTGTTPLVAALNHHQSTAIEVNPFLAFTAKVKTSAGKWNTDRFNVYVNRIIEESTRGEYSPLEGFSTFTERDVLTKWLFNKSVLRRYTSLVKVIDDVGGTYRDSLKLAAIVAAYDCCNARRDGKALRYKKNWKDLKYSDKEFVNRFRVRASVMGQDVASHSINSEFRPIIINGDSRKLLSTLDNKSFDLVVTSPPYLNSFDYSDIYRPELFLGGYVKDNNELKSLRLKTLRSHVQTLWTDDMSFESMLLNPIKERLKNNEMLWNKNIPLMVHAYFDDMHQLFQELKPKLRRNGQVWLVVSTSAFGGVHIPVDLILADAAIQAGFSLQGIHCLRQLRTSGQQWKHFATKLPPLRESLLIMSV